MHSNGIKSINGATRVLSSLQARQVLSLGFLQQPRLLGIFLIYNVKICLNLHSFKILYDFFITPLI